MINTNSLLGYHTYVRIIPKVPVADHGIVSIIDSLIGCQVRPIATDQQARTVKVITITTLVQPTRGLSQAIQLENNHPRSEDQNATATRPKHDELGCAYWPCAPHNRYFPVDHQFSSRVDHSPPRVSPQQLPPITCRSVRDGRIDPFQLSHNPLSVSLAGCGFSPLL